MEAHPCALHSPRIPSLKRMSKISRERRVLVPVYRSLYIVVCILYVYRVLVSLYCSVGRLSSAVVCRYALATDNSAGVAAVQGVGAATPLMLKAAATRAQRRSAGSDPGAHTLVRGLSWLASLAFGARDKTRR